jgi:Subtilase family
MRRPLALVAVPLLVLLGGAATARTADAGTAAAAVPAGPEDPARTATLITGDRVTLPPGGGMAIRPGKGRAKIPMLSSTVNGHTRVIPADAVPLLRNDRLDPRLFDVTSLIAAGYDDRRGDLPLIVGDAAASPAADASTGTTVRHLSSVKATAVHTRKRDVGGLWSTIRRASSGKRGAAGSSKVWLDAVGHPTGAEGVQQIGAPAAWQAGLTGAGVTLGIVDSGVDVTHPDLAGVVAAQMDFSPLATGGAPTNADVHDYQGHGTGVASIMAGSGAASGGRYRGVAPGARMVSAKVGDWDTTESAVIAAMEWVAGDQHAKIVNMSLGFEDAPGLDPIEAAVNSLTQQYGTLFVVAAGNDGINGNDPGNGNDYDISSPASADAALSVGAVDHEDRLADFSSRVPA